MSAIRVFRVKDIKEKTAKELKAKSANLEKNLQTFVEKNMKLFFSTKFLATEYQTTKPQKGRIDSLGLDKNYAPVIVEYKRGKDQNILNQGLFYLDWLLTHQSNFKMLVMDKLDQKTSKKIDFSKTRLILIAHNFSRFDLHAVEQNNHNIELIRYEYFDENFFLLENIGFKKSAQKSRINTKTIISNSSRITKKKLKQDLVEMLNQKAFIADLYNELFDYAKNLANDTNVKKQKFYTAIKRGKNNFACFIKLEYQLKIYLKLDPKKIKLQKDKIVDKTGIGHHGTGNLELIITEQKDIKTAKILIKKSYKESK